MLDAFRFRSILKPFCLATMFVLGVPGVDGAYAPTGEARAAAFDRWVKSFRKQARRSGVSTRTYNRAFKGVRPDPEVLRAASNQPEFAKPIWEYLKTAVSDKRVETGTREMENWRKTLAAIERKYGVDRYIVAAIWGMESNFGSHKGDHYVVRALATLGYKGRRKRFGRSQLIAALKILQRGDITPDQMKGSWAGAMGHTQFIPTTYNGYAVDYNGDGRRDIWNTVSDALASTANYLRASKWRKGQPWGHEVVLPRGFRYALASRRIRKSTADWVGLGVKRADGRKFGAWARPGSIVLPAGGEGPAFLIYDNFRSIMRYNNSVAYALAVGLLADRLRGRKGVIGEWPQDVRPLTAVQKRELQTLLRRRGFYRGRIDGLIGTGTESAIRSYQKRAGLVPDGFASLKLLRRLKKGS